MVQRVSRVSRGETRIKRGWSGDEMERKERERTIDENGRKTEVGRPFIVWQMARVGRFRVDSKGKRGDALWGVCEVGKRVIV